MFAQFEYYLLPQLIGILFNVGLQSALTVQTFYLVCIYEWVQTGLVVVYVFAEVSDSVAGYLLGINDVWVIVYIMCALQSAAVQTYFARRVYILSQSRIITGFVIVVALAQMCCGIIAADSALKVLNNYFGNDIPDWNGTTISWLVGSTLADVTIALTLVILFHKMKNGLKQTDILMKRLARVVIETGTLTATTAIVILVLFIKEPVGVVYVIIGHPLMIIVVQLWAICPMLFFSKLYANSALFTLNNRAIINSAQGEDGRNAIVLIPTVPHLQNNNRPLEIVADDQYSPTVISIVLEEDVSTSAVKYEESV
ncbi:uncharacterized protein LAESUDRAFT_540592 [Laetiporus sulphureus 93-53]|uniref:DUF6534 domain-containing protein n=1 Tax=Laetiporus sulphureus 93-53 TaxID=1314785 RepID=A0A165FLJ9_9APHY|nr:uncharacterized protein LAESUDRAFT_540592 [Laetiporus sulphureus 93-53]KZT09152.1 hypothetical protein LAESUDRAFT_540592 [Laetiporus sulphureus 93-53]